MRAVPDRILIIGGGVIGCSTALALRRAGLGATVLEKSGGVGHGSTSASCAIVRRFYSQPNMIAMAHEGAKTWADWSRFLGPINDELAVFHQPGMLFIPPTIDEACEEIAAQMREVGVPVEILTAKEIEQRFPMFDARSNFPPKTPSDEGFFDPPKRHIDGGIFEADAGYVVSPTLATQNLREAAIREGASFLMNHEVIGVRHGTSSRFVVELRGKAPLEADVLINIAGPHSSKINQMVGTKTVPQTRALRREVHLMKNPSYREGDGGSFPVVGDLDGGIYFRPEAGGREVLVGSTDPDCDGFEWVDDPDNFRDHVTELYQQRQCLRFMKRVKNASLGPRRGIAALYDVSVADWYPIVDRTEIDGYYVCIGTSGSSFKTAPVLGQLVAALVHANESGANTDDVPIEFKLPYLGRIISPRFLSRTRNQLQSTGTVIG